MERKTIKDTREPLSVRELRDFLNRLIMGGCGNFKIKMLSSNRFGTNSTPIHYTLDGHNKTVKLDDLDDFPV